MKELSAPFTRTGAPIMLMDCATWFTDLTVTHGGGFVVAPVPPDGKMKSIRRATHD
jgi:hypothetical protein